MISAKTSKSLTAENVSGTIFSLWRLVNDQHESELIRQESAHMALKVLDRYKRQLEPTTYREVLGSIGSAATNTLVELLEEANTAEVISGSTNGIRIQSERVILTARELK